MIGGVPGTVISAAMDDSARRPGRRRLPFTLALLTLGSAACNNTSFFTVGRDRTVCEDSIPTACSTTARCVLDTSHYINGDFPGSRRFIVRAAADSDLKFEIYLDDRRAPGTMTRLDVAEPGCGEKHQWDSAGTDIFQDSGMDGIIEVPVHTTQAGDHLVELSSDAYCSFVLKFSTK